MDSKTAVMTPADTPAKPFQVFKCQVSLMMAGDQDSLNDFKQLLEVDGDHHNLMIDRLIKLPAFVEDGVGLDHPRSRERWASLMWNTLDPKIKVTRLVSSLSDNVGDVQCRLEFDAHVPTVMSLGEKPHLMLGRELTMFFDDCAVLTVWKLTDEWGDSLYGIGSMPYLIQPQTEAHENLHLMFANDEVTIKEIASA